MMQQIEMKKWFLNSYLSWVVLLYHGHSKSKRLSLSSTEVEFRAATSCECHALLMEELKFKQSAAAIALCNNGSTNHMHGRSKHIGMKYYLLRLTQERWNLKWFLLKWKYNWLIFSLSLWIVLHFVMLLASLCKTTTLQDYQLSMLSVCWLWYCIQPMILCFFVKSKV